MSSPAASPAALPLAARLQSALTVALRTRDMIAVSAIRSALAAIANAEAVAVPAGPGMPAGSPFVAGAPSGAGAADVARRRLTATDTERIVAAEIIDLEAAAAQYARLGKDEHAARLRHEAAVLADVLGEGS